MKIPYPKQNLQPIHLFKHLFLFLTFFYTIQSTTAQWSTTPIATTKNLFSVDYFSTNDIWIGGSTEIVRTSNNGANWSVIGIVDPVTGPIIGGMYDIELTSSTSAIGTGLFYLGNTECILHTSNSGTFWSLVWDNPSGPFLRQIRSVDRFGSICIGVGNTGHVRRSTTSGTSWSIIATTTTKMINDVKFIDSLNVFAVGDDVFLKSNNAGQSWTTVSRYGNYFTLSCVPNCMYIGQEFGDTLTKSVNNGQTFTNIRMPFDYRGVVHAISADTVLVAGVDGLYISRDGAASWEKFLVTNYHEINQIDFRNSNGIAVGDSGYVIRTSNLNNCPSIPVPVFSITSGTEY